MAISTRTVQVLPGTAVTVLALGLLPGEQLRVGYAIDMGCSPADAQYEPTSECCADAVIGEDNNPFTLWRPGWYKIEPVGAINPAALLQISPPFPAQATMAGNNCCPPSHVVGIQIEPDGRITLIFSDGTTITTVSSVIIPPLIAAVFNTCLDTDQVPNAQLALCSDIPTNEEIAALFRDCNNNALTPFAQVATCADIPSPAEIAAVFMNCQGDPLAPNTQLVTCGDFGDPTSAPATTEEPELPTTMYGARTALLGQPVGWIDVGGKKLPYY